jgi:hypothetical protein
LIAGRHARSGALSRYEASISRVSLLGTTGTISKSIKSLQCTIHCCSSRGTVAATRSALTGSKLAWRHSAALSGPAVVASVAYMDPGNFATNIQAGSRYGYDLLWVVVPANLVAMLFQAWAVYQKGPLIAACATS